MSLDRVKNILLVLSGKGGVGKSSITTQLALSLSLSGRSVGILDVDLTGPSIPRFLGIESSKIKQAPGGWLPVEVHAAQTLDDAPAVTYPPPRQPTAAEGEGNVAQPTPGPADANAGANDAAFDPLQPSKPVGAVHAMSLAFLLASRESAIVWRGPKKTAMVRQFLSDVLWPELDYLLIDTPPGTSDEHISLVETLLKNVATAQLSTAEPAGGVQMLDGGGGAGGRSSGPNLAGAVVVTTPQAVAVSDVRKEINFCAKTGVKVVGVVENMSGYICPCCGEEAKLFSKGGGRVMARDFGVEFLGEVPVDSLWGELVEEGRRPKYEKFERKEGEAEEEQDSDEDDFDIEDAEENEAPKEKEPGLLVDKYRNCSLSPMFADITKKVVGIVDNDTAVTVNPNAVRA